MDPNRPPGSKPYLKKGTGKYAKISYPVLRRSGVFQPPPDEQPVRRESSPKRRERREDPIPSNPPHTSTYSTRRPSPPLSSPPIVPPLNLGVETGVMGQLSPGYSERSSRESGSPPPRATAFGSSMESRLRESADEGMGRDFGSSSPGFPSGRPRTAATVDSGFPREEMVSPALSPASSSGETRASSFPSMMVEDTMRGGEAEREEEEDGREEEEKHPVQPIPTVRRSKNGDRSVIGNTTEEFERRERQCLGRREDQQEEEDYGRVQLSPSSSLNTSTSAVTRSLAREGREILEKAAREKGEEPFFRHRIAQQRPVYGAAAAAVRPVGGVYVGEESDVLNGLQRPMRMISTRLDATVASDASIPSPIERIPSERDGGEGSGFHPDDFSSHFRIATSSVDSMGGGQGRMNERGIQHPSLPYRRIDYGGDGESSQWEASSGSTAAARRLLLGDRRPLDEVLTASGKDVITRTQQRPRYVTHAAVPLQQTRASQATMRRDVPLQQPTAYERSDGVWDEEEEPTISVRPRGEREREQREEVRARGTSTRGQPCRHEEEEHEMRRQRVVHMEWQLRDAIAHADLAEAAMREMARELRSSFETKSLSLAAAYKDREDKMMADWREKEEEWKAERKKIGEMKAEVEKERKLLRKDESVKVKEWRTKFEDEHSAYVDLKKKYAKESSLKRILESKTKKERDETAAEMSVMRTENDRMRRIIEGTQRDRASSRGHSAHRAALFRAENEAASAPRRNGLVKTRFGGGLSDKENEGPLVGGATEGRGGGAASAAPQGILKNVRFADTTFTVQSPDESMREISRGQGEWGPCVTFANHIGNVVTVSTPACSCLIFHYANGDVRHLIPDRSVTLHYFAGCGSMQLDFPQDRCQLRYYVDGSLEIFRSGKEITRCSANGERVEMMRRPDGTMYAEIWQDNSMAIYDGRMGESRPQYQTGKTVSHRAGGSWVALHSNKDLEFIEKSFLVVYFADTKEVKLALRNTSSEMQYILRPSESGQIMHVGMGGRGERCKQQCCDFGYHQRLRSIR